MRALVVDHDNHSPPGLVGERLDHHGVDLVDLVVVTDPRRPRSAVTFPDPTRFDLVVAMGSPWSVYDRATIGTWIDRELAMLRAALAADVPVLGICFGGQALAAAAGGRVERAPRPEIGWCTVDSAHPDVLAPGPWFQWHVDRFHPPADATTLARSPVGTQAFRIGRSLGLQFHPEVGTDVLSTWLRATEDAELARLGTSPSQLLDATREMEHRARPNTEALVDHFLGDVARLG